MCVCVPEPIRWIVSVCKVTSCILIYKKKSRIEDETKKNNVTDYNNS